jgi:hypothetical protein
MKNPKLSPLASRNRALLWALLILAIIFYAAGAIHVGS